MGACQISQLGLDKYKKDYKEPERICRGHNSSGTLRLWELGCSLKVGEVLVHQEKESIERTHRLRLLSAAVSVKTRVQL